MKFIITGYRGFIGQYLCNELSSRNIEFIGVDHSDILGDDYFDGIVVEKGDVMVHLANRSFVPDSWEDPAMYIETNSMGTLKVLEFCKKGQLGLIYLSSYMYGNPQYFPVDEKHPVQIMNPYAFSKKTAEEIIQYYGENFGINYVILRPFNVYGKGQKDNFIIPILFQKFLDSNLKTVQMNDLKPKRDFIHAKDLVNAIVLCSENLNQQIYNVTSGHSVSILELAQLIKKLLNSDKEIEDLSSSRKNEIMDCYGTFEKIKNGIGWEPLINLETGLKEYIY